jgi:hypothetical protein
VQPGGGAPKAGKAQRGECQRWEQGPQSLGGTTLSCSWILGSQVWVRTGTDVQVRVLLVVGTREQQGSGVKAGGVRLASLIKWSGRGVQAGVGATCRGGSWEQMPDAGGASKIGVGSGSREREGRRGGPLQRQREGAAGSGAP